MKSLKKYSRLVLTAVVVLVLLALSAPAGANHILDTYRGRGYVWFAAYTDKVNIWTTSTQCNPRELEAYTRVRETTVDEFPVRWPSGIRMERSDTSPCDGSVDIYTDIKLKYEPSSEFNNNSYGGWNENMVAAESWCDIWGKNYKCGTHPAVVHLNKARFGNDDYSDHYRRRLIMHETGHSFGLAHHCSSDSIMNDGTSDCNGGAWTNINGYQQTDLTGILNIYPNWKYS